VLFAFFYDGTFILVLSLFLDHVSPVVYVFSAVDKECELLPPAPFPRHPAFIESPLLSQPPSSPLRIICTSPPLRCVFSFGTSPLDCAFFADEPISHGFDPLHTKRSGPIGISMCFGCPSAPDFLCPRHFLSIAPHSGSVFFPAPCFLSLDELTSFLSVSSPLILFLPCGSCSILSPWRSASHLWYPPPPHTFFTPVSPFLTRASSFFGPPYLLSDLTGLLVPCHF